MPFENINYKKITFFHFQHLIIQFNFKVKIIIFNFINNLFYFQSY